MLKRPSDPARQKTVERAFAAKIPSSDGDSDITREYLFLERTLQRSFAAACKRLDRKRRSALEEALANWAGEVKDNREKSLNGIRKQGTSLMCPRNWRAKGSDATRMYFEISASIWNSFRSAAIEVGRGQADCGELAIVKWLEAHPEASDIAARAAGPRQRK
jgi:hypothetical protein